MASVHPSEPVEPMAKRISGTAAERRRDQAPNGVLVALRTVHQAVIARGRFGPSWSQRLVMAKWVLSGAAVMEVEGRRLAFGPGQVAIYLPTIPHRFWAVEPVNDFCWFTCDGPFAEPLLLELGLRPGVFAAPPPTPERMRELARSLLDHSLEGRRQASLLAIAEWYRLADLIRAQPAQALAAQVRHLIAQEFADPNLSVAGIARRLGHHRATLSRLYQEQTGETVIAHLSAVRLREARALLLHTGERVADIARQCGFTQAAYFCRWFRKQVGSSPGGLRDSERGA